MIQFFPKVRLPLPSNPNVFNQRSVFKWQMFPFPLFRSDERNILSGPLFPVGKTLSIYLYMPLSRVGMLGPVAAEG